MLIMILPFVLFIVFMLSLSTEFLAKTLGVVLAVPMALGAIMYAATPFVIAGAVYYFLLTDTGYNAPIMLAIRAGDITPLIDAFNALPPGYWNPWG